MFYSCMVSGNHTHYSLGETLVYCEQKYYDRKLGIIHYYTCSLSDCTCILWDLGLSMLGHDERLEVPGVLCILGETCDVLAQLKGIFALTTQNMIRIVTLWQHHRKTGLIII